MRPRKLTPALATRIFAKQHETTVDRVRSAVEKEDGFDIVEVDEGLGWRVVPGRSYTGRCDGREFATFIGEPDLHHLSPISRGVAVTWEDEALYSLEVESEFRAFVERVRSSIEPVELATLVATWRGMAEFGHALSPFLEKGDLDFARDFARPGEVDRIEGLAPLRIEQDPSTDMILDFFGFGLRGRHDHTIDFVRWHVELGPSGLFWRSAAVAALRDRYIDDDDGPDEGP